MLGATQQIVISIKFLMVKEIPLRVDVHKMLHFSTSLHPRQGNIATVGEGHCLADLNSQRSREFSSSRLSRKGRVTQGGGGISVLRDKTRADLI